MFHPSDVIPVSIVTGFLGAGKSTLLNRLLHAPALSDAAVIINEFGEVGIDHMLVETSGENVVELSNGCLCCTVRGELIDTLADLLDKAQTGRIKPFSRVIIETTGLADPVPVLKAVMAHPAIAATFRVDGVVTLVDAISGLKTIETYDEAARQAAVADRLVMTKTDLVDEDTVSKLRSRLSAINPMAEIVDVNDEIASRPTLLVAGLFDPENKPGHVGEWLSNADTGHHHHHHHDVNRHGEHIRAFALQTGPVDSLSTIQAFLQRLAAQYGEKLLRIKGTVAVSNADAPFVVHGVQETVYPPRRLKSAGENDKGNTRLVVITRDLPEADVRDLFNAFLNNPVIDRPDRAALEDNPLSAFGFKLS